MLILPTTTAEIPSRVLQAYPLAVTHATWLRIRGGFSGAGVWRGTTMAGDSYALKCHDTTRLDEATLTTIHRWMVQAHEALGAVIPTVLRPRMGGTFVRHEQALWEVLTWLPGVAGDLEQCSLSRVQNVLRILERLHAAWADPTLAPRPIPAVQRRLAALRAWRDLFSRGWKPYFNNVFDPVQPWAEQAWLLLQRNVHRVEQQLQRFATRVVPVQPCLCDCWHDHVLFTGDAVSGVVDYSAMKLDHPAVDLARYLGSIHPASAIPVELLRSVDSQRYPPELIQVLDCAGTAVAMTHWLRWLYHEQRVLAERTSIAERLRTLCQRFVAMLP